MNEAHVDWVKELEYEQEGTGLAREKVGEFYTGDLSGGEPAREAAAGTGGWLIQRRPRPARIRYRSIARIEETYARYADDPDMDYGTLIVGAAAQVEQELNALLVSPAQPFADRLLAALVNAKDDGPAAGLRWWAEGKGVATLGTSSLLLMAIRRALTAGDAEVQRFLAETFDSAFPKSLAVKGVGVCLDHLRQRFRNAACHGREPEFSLTEYHQFARLAVGHVGFLEWERDGPAPVLMPDESGVLHRLLAASRSVIDAV